MTIYYNAVGNDRKHLVLALKELTGEMIRYVGPPTFAYYVGGFTVTRGGNIELSNTTAPELVNQVVEGLKEHGFVTDGIQDDGQTEMVEREQNLVPQAAPIPERPEAVQLDISLPVDGWDGNALRRLALQVYGMQYLLNRSLGTTSFMINAAVAQGLTENRMPDRETFLNVFHQHFSDGLSFDDGTVTFHLFCDPTSDKAQAFQVLLPKILERTKNAKSAMLKEQRPENEKFYFRNWLTELGMSGPTYKVERKVLMRGLSGQTAFKTDAEMEVFKKKMRAERAAAKAAAMQGEGE